MSRFDQTFKGTYTGLSSAGGMGAGGGGASIDPSVIFATTFQGANGSQTDLADDTGNHTISFVGDAQISTAQSKFNGSSLLVDGTGDYCTVPDSDIWQLDDDFTFSAWVYWTGGATFRGILGRYGNGVTNPAFRFYALGWNSTHYGHVWQSDGTSRTPSGSATGTSQNAWYHFMVTGDVAGTSIRVYANGSRVATNSSWDGTNQNYGGATIIGATAETVHPFQGYIDDVCLAVGKAYTKSDTTYTLPTVPMAEALLEV